MLRRKESEINSAQGKDGSIIRHKNTELRLYSEDSEKIKLDFTPVNIPEDWVIHWIDWTCYDNLSVFRTDYERLLLPLIDKLFPVRILTPKGWNVWKHFDAAAPNWFGLKDWQKLISLIEERSKEVNADEKEFYTEVLGFLRGCTEISSYFCIDGNLWKFSEQEE